MTYENFNKTIDFMGDYRGAKPPIAEKWVFISRRLIHRVGGKNIEKHMFPELLDKAHHLKLIL